MKKNRIKAQGALEYLLIVGVAVLVVAIVVLALSGILNTAKEENEIETDSIYSGLQGVIDASINKATIILRLNPGENTIQFSALGENNTWWSGFGTTSSGNELVNGTIIQFEGIELIKEDGQFVNTNDYSNANDELIPINVPITIIIPQYSEEQVFEFITNSQDTISLVYNENYFDNTGANIINQEQLDVIFEEQINSIDFLEYDMTNLVEINTCQELIDKIRLNLSGKYVLKNNLNCVGISSFPINATNSPFIGVLDGNGYTISNLTIRKTDNHSTGLFSFISGALIQRINLENIDVNGTMNYVGSIVGRANSSIIYKVSINGKIQGGPNMTGGLIGFSKSNNKISKVSTNVDMNGNKNVGALIGYSQKDIIQNCFTTGETKGIDYGVTGLIPTAINSKISNCYAAGKVNGVLNYTAGINFSSTETNWSNVYYDTQTTQQTNSNGGIGKTTIEMKKQSTFENWDFTNVWQISEGSTYPYFK